MVWSSVQVLLPSCSTSGGQPALVELDVGEPVAVAWGGFDVFAFPVPFIEDDQAEKAAPEVHDRHLSQA